MQTLPQPTSKHPTETSTGNPVVRSVNLKDVEDRVGPGVLGDFAKGAFFQSLSDGFQQGPRRQQPLLNYQSQHPALQSLHQQQYQHHTRQPREHRRGHHYVNGVRPLEPLDVVPLLLRPSATKDEVKSKIGFVTHAFATAPP